MTARKVMAEAKRFAIEELELQATIIAVAPREDGWRVTLEAVVEAEYVRQRAGRDLMAVYELLVDQKGVVTAFERKEIRERGIPTGGH